MIEKEQISLAKEIMGLQRNILTVELPFLARAFARLHIIYTDGTNLASDGRDFLVSPGYIIRTYQKNSDELIRNYLHVYLHCLYQHMYKGRTMNIRYWNLACDIAVEHSISTLGKLNLQSGEHAKRRETLRYLRGKIPMMTAENIYRWLMEMCLTIEQMEQLKDSFCVDDHAIWYLENVEEDSESLRSDWSELSEDIEKTIEREHMDSQGSTQQIGRLARQENSYHRFLQRFATMTEVMRISEDEMDMNYYMYGLTLYSDLPLIEPLEYREEKLAREFAIVLDTSGSVQGELVQSFVQHTYDILSEKNQLHELVNIHIIQCDDQIREDVCIHTKQEFDRYISTMELKGFGKTDFRPAFVYIDQLIAKNAFQNFRGLVYFTDGKGYFPETKPSYETAFIIHGRKDQTGSLPDWIASMCIGEEDILDGTF